MIITWSTLLSSRVKTRQKCWQKLAKIKNAISQLFLQSMLMAEKNATSSTIESSDSKSYSKIELEEHYVVVGEPINLHLSHLSVEGSKA